MQTRRNILVIRFSAMGDVAMTSPVVDAVCRNYADCEVYYLSTPLFEPFFAKHTNFHYIASNIRNEKHGLLALWRLFRQLRKTANFNEVVDLHDVLRTKILRTLFRLFTKARVVKIDKGRAEKKALVHGKHKEQLKTTIERYCDVFARAELPVDELQAPLEAAAPDGNIRIGVSPFAGHPGKVYTLDKMREVVRLLCSYGHDVYVFGGGKREKDIAEQWASNIKGCHSVIGKVKLAEEMKLMSSLKCMISMDSSAMHICSLFGVTVVSVWGATHPYAGFLGFNQSLENAVQLDNLDCRPCSIYGNKPCRFNDYRCFSIEPEKIVEKVINCVN